MAGANEIMGCATHGSADRIIGCATPVIKLMNVLKHIVSSKIIQLLLVNQTLRVKHTLHRFRVNSWLNPGYA